MFLKYTYIFIHIYIIKSIIHIFKVYIYIQLVYSSKKLCMQQYKIHLSKNHLHWSLPLAVQFLRSNNIPLCNIPQVIHCFPEAFRLFPKKVFTFVNSIAPQYSHSCFLMSICKFFLDILHPGVELLDHKINKNLNSEDNTTGDP